MAKEETKKQGKPKKKRNFLKMTMLWMVCIILVIFLQLSFILFLVGMIPTGIAYLTDDSDYRHKFHCVLPCNMAGVIPYMAQLLANGNEVGQMQAMMGDIGTIAVMYSCAGLGWILYGASPHMASAFVRILNSRKTGNINAIQQQLVKEWGPEIQSRDALKGPKDD
ncbi:MAG: hypothetical protein MRY32_01845 [Rickettsiales bacterium]|nr:hypothetical protein [Rickettsiales bacterium]